MNDKKNSNEKLLSMIIESIDGDLGIYVGDPNGKYEYKRSMKENSCYDYIDLLETDGVFSEDDTDSCFIDDASYVVLRTYNHGDILKTNVLLSYEMYGLVSSRLLSNKDQNLFVKFNSKTKGTLDTYTVDEKDNCFSICPVSDNAVCDSKSLDNNKTRTRSRA